MLMTQVVWCFERIWTVSIKVIITSIQVNMSKNCDNGNIQYAELRSGGQFINSPRTGISPR